MSNDKKSNALALVPSVSPSNHLVPANASPCNALARGVSTSNSNNPEPYFTKSSMTLSVTGDVTFTMDKKNKYVAYVDPTKRCLSIDKLSSLSSVSSNCDSIAREINMALVDNSDHSLLTTAVISDHLKVFKIYGAKVVNKNGKQKIKLSLNEELNTNGNYAKETVQEIEDKTEHKDIAFTMLNVNISIVPIGRPIDLLLPLDRVPLTYIPGTNWWRAGTPDQPYGGRIWINTPDIPPISAWITSFGLNPFTMGSWVESTRTLQIWLRKGNGDPRREFRRIEWHLNEARLPEGFRPGVVNGFRERIQFSNCDAFLCVGDSDSTTGVCSEPTGVFEQRFCSSGNQREQENLGRRDLLRVRVTEYRREDFSFNSSNPWWSGDNYY